MSFRILKLNELIKEELGKILLKEFEFEGSLLTITRVETASNSSVARVFISVFPEKRSAAIFKILEAQIYFLQQRLNKRLEMRPVPRLIFRQEKETLAAGRVEELLERVKEGPVDPVTIHRKHIGR